MNKPIGVTFPQELEAAGLLGLPFAWGNDGQINFGEEITNAQKAAILAVYEQHDPTAVPPVAPVTPLDKLKSFLSANPDVASLLT